MRLAIGNNEYIPVETGRIYPPRIKNLWLAVFASLGSSLMRRPTNLLILIIIDLPVNYN
jgi:hypothetical protein